MMSLERTRPPLVNGLRSTPFTLEPSPGRSIMAQQYYNLEEAASKLGISADELREMAKKKQIRAFQDKGNWRFRASEIDERARQMGGGSEPDMTLADSAKLSDSGKRPAEPAKKAPDQAKKPPVKTKQPSDAEVLPVDFQLEEEVSLG